MTQIAQTVPAPAKAAAKEKLIAAGLRLISGRTPLTSRVLAAEAQVNHAMINYHFGGLGELLDLLAERCIEELRLLLAPELDKLEQAAACGDKGAAKAALRGLLGILSGPQGARLLSALTQPQPGAGRSVYPRVMEAVLKPMHKSFSALLARFRGGRAGSLDRAVLGQLMIAECMAFFRGGGVVLEQLGQTEFTPAQVEEINATILESLCAKAGLN